MKKLNNYSVVHHVLQDYTKEIDIRSMINVEPYFLF